jgi:hypothetical protein
MMCNSDCVALERTHSKLWATEYPTHFPLDITHFVELTINRIEWLKGRVGVWGEWLKQDYS